MFLACSLPGLGGSAAARRPMSAATPADLPRRIASPQSVTWASAAAMFPAGTKHQEAFHR